MAEDEIVNPVHVVLAADANCVTGLRATRARIVRSCRSPDRLVFHEFNHA